MRDERNYESHPSDDQPVCRMDRYKPAIPPGGLYAREARFVQALLEELQGRAVTDGVLLAAARRSLRTKSRHEPNLSRELLLKARRIMSFPNVRAHVLDLFARADFTPEDAAAAHVKHIREGNFAALQAYWGLTLPKEPRAVEVKAAVLNVTPDAFDKARTPVPIAARTLDERPDLPPEADEEEP